MQRFLLLCTLLATVQQQALGDCGAPSFSTRCVTARVTKILETEADLRKRNSVTSFKEKDWSCRREIKGSQFNFPVYVMPVEDCPKNGTEILGDLVIPCNDAGQGTPTRFIVRNLEFCEKAAKDPKFRARIYESARPRLIRTTSNPPIQDSLINNVIDRQMFYCLPKAFESDVLKFGEVYGFAAEFEVRGTKWNERTTTAVCEKLKITSITPNLPSSVVSCLKDTLGSFPEVFSGHLPPLARVSTQVEFGKMK